MILDRLEEVRRRIARAAQRRGIAPEAVDLVAVVKQAAPEDVRALLRSGQVRFFGESRIQDARARRLEIGPDAESASWRFIGHLQSNKAAAAAGLFESIDSLDSLKLARVLDERCAAEGRRQKVLVQVKLADRQSQSGVAPSDLEEFLRLLKARPRVEPCGLFAIAPMIEPVEGVRPFFRRMKELFDRHFPEGASPERRLSVGMSRDYEIAVEEGGNLLRIGTALFGP